MIPTLAQEMRLVTIQVLRRQQLLAAALALLVALPWWLSRIAATRAYYMRQIFADLLDNAPLPWLTVVVLNTAPFWWLLLAMLTCAIFALLTFRRLSELAAVMLGLLILGVSVLMPVLLNEALMAPLTRIISELGK